MHFDATFWVAAATIVFIILAWKPAGKAVTQALDKRSLRIKAELDEALRLREEAQALLTSFQRKQRDALQEAEEIIEEARKSAAQMLQDAEKKLEEELSKRVQLASEKITRMETTALDDVKAHAVDIAVATARQLIMEQMDKDTADALFRSTLDDVRQKLN